jgi:PAS domain S-box-containing protein
VVRELDRREAERTAAADRLRFSEERYRTLAQEAFDAFVVTDAGGRIRFASGSYERLTGYAPEERLGADATGLIHPEQVENALKTLRLALDNPGKTYRSERLVRRKDGEWRTFEVALTNLLDNPAVAGLVSNFRDVTDRVESEAARQDSEERFRGAFHEAPIGMALMSLEGRFLQANLALEDLLGYGEDELLGMTREDITSPDECFADDLINDLITGRRSSVQVQRRLMHSDGEVRHCTVSLSAVHDTGGNPAYLIMQFADVTPLTRARQELEQALSSKDELVASVSHELRTPLTSVIGFGELLREHSAEMSAAERHDLTRAMTDQARDLAGIVEDLLVVARTDADVMRLTRVPVDLRAQAAQVLEAWDWSDTSHIELAKGSTRAMGDPARVRQILRNLITNAMRYGGESIRLECSTDGTRALVRVIDDGPGVPRDAEERVFDRYQRASNAPGVTASMGLGLTVSRRLARLMDGDLEYRREDGETVFELALPRAASGRSRDTEAA